MYFFPELPGSDCCKNYFRITDKDVLKRFYSGAKECGSRITDTNTGINKDSEGFSNLIDKTKKYELARLIREFFWRNFIWKTDDLLNWLDEFSPEVIFFCAGDSCFAYDIVDYVKERYQSKLALYITDDYILPRLSIAPFYWLRRNLILKKLRRAINYSDLFITISKEMKEIYKTIFGKESIIGFNSTNSYSKIHGNSSKNRKNGHIRLVYAGGLYYKRYKVLNLLGKALAKYNSNIENPKKAFLEIYCTLQPSKNILKKINIENGSEYCGNLNNYQLNTVLNSCDMPIMVESFDRESISSTKLSFSTKIPEYLALKKCIIAIGPEKVSSMKYLSNIAFCITDPKNIYIKLQEILNDKEKQKYCADGAFKIFEKEHDNEKIKKLIISNILRIFET